ncbi:MAG: TrpB-like pyridoxal phosphate-dependent enzyme [Candidatus Omnitrophota bacterium]
MRDEKIILHEKDIPREWYNVQADLPFCLEPPVNPATKLPLDPKDLEAIFPKELINQELSRKRWIEIPDEIRQIYKIWRPTPLHRALRLEKALKTPARIYYKDESVSPPGSHKTNTAIAQAYYNMKEGVVRICTETGAGQWGSALSYACNIFKLKCTVYMVKVSYEQKPFRKSLMHIWGAEVFSSPTDKTNAGREIRRQYPDTPGSLGIAISEAVEDAATHEDAKYSLGSVLNHVLLHQSVIGLEVKKQLKAVGEKPDVLVGCVGGGSNFAGLVFPFVKDKLKGAKIDFIAVEPTACPTMTHGPFTYDYGDTAKLTPLLKMYTLGHSFIPPGIHAGGLRYHGCAPLVSLLVNKGLVTPFAVTQTEIFRSAILFAQTEGHLPAPETAHAIHAAVVEALRAKEEKKAKCIVINYSGHGHFDLAAYDNFLEGKLKDYHYPKEMIEKALDELKCIGV